ncbi:MAG: hypothetical protein QG635_2257 [Bacteroidota bacterium]|nr:hypothetical protein [Bacteroidota bacterium]
MKRFRLVLFTLIIFVMCFSVTKSFAPKDKNFGLGVILGEPTGLTAKLWLHNNSAFAFCLGNSYLGTLRVGVDYLWHFNAFNSSIVSLYAGPGIAIGIGESSGWLYVNKDRKWYRADDNIGLGARAVFGVNIVPRNTPLEFFGEIGVLVGFNPTIYTNVEGAIGFRFYF